MSKKKSFQSLNIFEIECPVCFEITSKYYLSPCKHAWCNNCNMNSEFERKCPICRITVPLSPKSRKKLEKKKKRKEFKKVMINAISMTSFSITGLSV